MNLYVKISSPTILLRVKARAVLNSLVDVEAITIMRLLGTDTTAEA